MNVQIIWKNRLKTKQNTTQTNFIIVKREKLRQTVTKYRIIPLEMENGRQSEE